MELALAAFGLFTTDTILLVQISSNGCSDYTIQRFLRCHILFPNSVVYRDDTRCLERTDAMLGLCVLLRSRPLFLVIGPITPR